MTEFRRDQAKVLLLNLLHTLAPRMAGKGTLRKLLRELVDNEPLWRELGDSWAPLDRGARRPGPAVTPPAPPVMTSEVHDG